MTTATKKAAPAVDAAAVEPKAKAAPKPKPEPKATPAPAPVATSTGKRSLADRLKADDDLNKSKPSAPFAQLLNSQGRIFLGCEQAEKSGIDVDLLLSSGWVNTTTDLGTDTVDGYSTDHLRCVLAHRYSTWNNDTSKYDKYLQMFLLTPDNALINTDPIQLKLRGGSVASGTFYGQVENVKEQSWIAAIFKAFNELFGNRGGSGEFQSGVILDIQTRMEIKGTGKDKSKALVFYGCQMPTAASIDDGSMFVHFDVDPHNSGGILKDRILAARAVFQARIDERKTYAAQDKQGSEDAASSEDDLIPDGAEY